jgi:hypothetical protein
MDVTAENFHAAYPQFHAALDRASFVAMDLELTGLDSHQRNRTNSYDTLHERCFQCPLQLFCLLRLPLIC